MGFVFTQPVNDVLANGVGLAEVGEDGQAEAEIEVTCYQRSASGENVEEVDVEVKADADIDETAFHGSLTRLESI